MSHRSPSLTGSRFRDGMTRPRGLRIEQAVSYKHNFSLAVREACIDGSTESTPLKRFSLVPSRGLRKKHRNLADVERGHDRLSCVALSNSCVFLILAGNRLAQRHDNREGLQ